MNKIMHLNNKIRIILSIGSFIASLIFAAIALLLPPPGSIDSSVLIFIAQLLVVCCSLLGLNLKLDLANKKFEATHEINNHEDIENIKQVLSHFDEKNIEKR